VILPSSLTSYNYVMLFNSNVTANHGGAESIYMNTSSDGLNWGTPTAILSRASNICDMIDARPIYDDNAALRENLNGSAYHAAFLKTTNSVFAAAIL